MNNSIKYVENGDLKFHLTELVPFILWFVFSIEFSAFFKKSKLSGNLLIFLIVVIIWLLPTLFALSNIHSSFFNYKNTTNITSDTGINLPPGIGYCFNSKVKKSDSVKGIVSYVDYKCLSSNKNFIRSIAKNLLNRSYYINYSIFLIVILAFNAITKINIFQNKFILFNIRYALLFGTLACLFPVFSPGFYIKSLWVNQLWSYIVSMNTSCFMFIGITILLIINNIKIF